MELWVSGGENEFKFSGELITVTNPAVRKQKPCYLKITFHLTLSWLFLLKDSQDVKVTKNFIKKKL